MRVLLRVVVLSSILFSACDVTSSEELATNSVSDDSTEWLYECVKEPWRGYDWKFVKRIKHRDVPTSNVFYCVDPERISSYCLEARWNSTWGFAYDCEAKRLGSKAYTWNLWWGD